MSYVDPGVGSLIIQIGAAAAVAIAVTAGRVRRRLLALFSRILGR